MNFILKKKLNEFICGITKMSLYVGLLKCYMDIFWMIRSGILFIAGLLFILFPNKVYKFSAYLRNKTGLKDRINIERDRKYYFHWGIIFIIISILLFGFSITR